MNDLLMELLPFIWIPALIGGVFKLIHRGPPKKCPKCESENFVCLGICDGGSAHRYNCKECNYRWQYD